jgi:hypothetical protein
VEHGCLLLLQLLHFIIDRSLLKWRERVGIEEANRITKRATARGTDFHQVCQDYLENKELNWDNYQPLTKFMFYHLKPELDKINNIHAIEEHSTQSILDWLVE